MNGHGFEQFTPKGPIFLGNVVIQVTGYQIGQSEHDFVLGKILGTEEEVRVRLQTQDEIRDILITKEESAARFNGRQPGSVDDKMPRLYRRPSIEDLGPTLPRKLTTTEVGGIVLFRDTYRLEDGTLNARWPEILSVSPTNIQENLANCWIAEVETLNNVVDAQIVAGMVGRYYTQGEGRNKFARLHLLDVDKADLITDLESFEQMLEISLHNESLRTQGLFRQMVIRAYRPAGDPIIYPVKPKAILGMNGKAVFNPEKSDYEYEDGFGIKSIIDKMADALRHELQEYKSTIEAIPAYSLGVGRATLHSETKKLPGPYDFIVPKDKVCGGSHGYRPVTAKLNRKPQMATHLVSALPIGVQRARHIFALKTPVIDPLALLVNSTLKGKSPELNEYKERHQDVTEDIKATVNKTPPAETNDITTDKQTEKKSETSVKGGKKTRQAVSGDKPKESSSNKVAESKDVNPDDLDEALNDILGPVPETGPTIDKPTKTEEQTVQADTPGEIDEEPKSKSPSEESLASGGTQPFPTQEAIAEAVDVDPGALTDALSDHGVVKDMDEKSPETDTLNIDFDEIRDPMEQCKALDNLMRQINL